MIRFSPFRSIERGSQFGTGLYGSYRAPTRLLRRLGKTLRSTVEAKSDVDPCD